MKTVSRAYKSSMKQLMRNHSYCTITFGNVDITAITDGTWNQDSGHVPFSNTSRLDYEYIYPNVIATLELNRWMLDGTQTLLDDSDRNDGWIGSAMSDANGVVDAFIQKSFQKQHQLPGVTAVWDDGAGNYPKEVTMQYGSGLSGAFYPDSVKTEMQMQGENVTSIKLMFSALLPYMRPRIRGVSWGVVVVFTNDDISSVKLSHDVDPLSRRLPNETLTFEVLDYDHKYDPENPYGVYSTINKGAPMKVQFSYELNDKTIENVKPDVYTLQDVPKFKDNKVTFTGCGLIGSLSEKYYKSELGTKSLYDMAEAVLLDANLTPTIEGNNPWEIDEALADMYTESVLPIDTHMNCLQLIAHAGRCRFYTDDDNIIHIRPFGVTPVGIFNGVYSDNGHASWSEWDTVNYGTDNETEYATLELNRWELGKNFTVMPDNDIEKWKEGYASEISDEYGENDSVWQREYDIVHDIPIIQLSFDTMASEYPIEFSVRYFDETNSEVGLPVYENPDTADYYMIESEYREDIKHIEVAMSRTLPFYRSRINKVSYRETDFSLTFDSIGEKQHSMVKLERLKNVVVNEYHYTDNGSSSELFKVTTTQTFIHAEYSLARNIQISVSGGTFTADIYGQAADIHLTPSTVGGTMQVLITGITLEQQSTTHIISANTKGDDDTETNPLITNTEMALALGNHIKEYLMLRNTYDDSYRGNPELETGDIIELETTYSDVVYGIVLTDEITFSGSLKGKVKVKGLV